MLDTLNQVDWSALTHAYGPATDVPDLLRDLASNKFEVREAGLYALYGNIWHQGTVYPATAFAVPFLIELLEAPTVGGKEELLRLLQALAEGNSFLDVHQRLDHYRHQSGTPEFAAKLEQELAAVRAAHRAVVEGVPVYLQLLEHPDSAVRMMSPYVLATCSERFAVIEPGLRSHLKIETDPKVRAGLVLALRHLRQRADRSEPAVERSAPEFRDLLSGLLGEAQPALVRLAAALSLLETGDATARAEAFPVLRQTLPGSRKELAELPWTDGDALGEVSRTLRGQPDLRMQLFLELLRHPEAALRLKAIFTAGEICRELRSAPPLVAPILGELLVDEDTAVRKSAARALARIGSAARVAVEPLLAAVQTQEADVCEHAALALAKMGEVRAVPAIVEMLSDSKVCLGALEPLKRFGPAAREGVPALRLLLRRSDDSQVRVRVAHVLGVIGPAALPALPDMLAALRDPKAAAGVAWALGQWGADAHEAVPELLRSLEGDDDYRRQIILKTLAQIGPAASQATPALIALLDDPDSGQRGQNAEPSARRKEPDGRVRANAALALWRIDGRTDVAVATSMEILRKKRKRTNADFDCVYAAETLCLIGPPARAAVPLLSEALNYPSYWVRVHAARALWRIAGEVEEILPTLLAELKCRPVGLLAVECLGEIGPRASAAIPALRQILSSEVRLKELGSEDSWIDEDEAFCASAARALQRIEGSRPQSPDLRPQPGHEGIPLLSSP